MKKLICLLCAGVILLFTECSKYQLDFKPDIPDVKSSSYVEQLPEDVIPAIESGIEWLLPTQYPEGFFYSSSEGVARTALAVTKLCDRSVELGAPPMEGIYKDEIQLGLDYIFSNANNGPVGGVYLSTNDNQFVIQHRYCHDGFSRS